MGGKVTYQTVQPDGKPAPAGATADQECRVCKTKANCLRCARCKQVFYCSQVRRGDIALPVLWLKMYSTEVPSGWYHRSAPSALSRPLTASADWKERHKAECK